MSLYFVPHENSNESATLGAAADNTFTVEVGHNAVRVSNSGSNHANVWITKAADTATATGLVVLPGESAIIGKSPDFVAINVYSLGGTDVHVQAGNVEDR